MPSRAMKIFEGWTLVYLTGAVMLGWFIVNFAVTGGTSEGQLDFIRYGVRPTLVLFALAFTASSLVKLWPNAFTRWQIKNRRYLGVSFATAHLLHFGAIVVWALRLPEPFMTQPPLAIWIGGLSGYLFIIAMLITSFNVPARAIGGRAWRLLHKVGIYYVWFLFTLALTLRSIADSFYYPFAAFMWALLLIRICANFARKRSTEATASAAKA